MNVKIIRKISIIFISLLVCAYFVIVLSIGTASSGPSNFSRYMAHIANEKIGANIKKTSGKVVASPTYSAGCDVFSLEKLTTNCGSVEVEQQIVDDGKLNYIIESILNPCSINSEKIAKDFYKLRKSIGCESDERKIKVTINIIKITTKKPDPNTTLNIRKKIGTLVVKNY